MTPADLSARIHNSIRLLQDQHETVHRYAHLLKDEHILDLGGVNSECLSQSDNQDLPLIEATSTAEVSDRLLRALFGEWPPTK